MKGRPIQKCGRCAGKPYRKSQKAYAHDYQVSLPTVKRWWAKGLPCDDADAMGEFLNNRGRQKENDTEFEGPSIVGRSFADDEVPTVPEGEGEVQEPETPVRLDKSFYEGKGFLAEIEKLQDAAQERRAAYFNAVLHGRGKRRGLELRNRLADWMNVLEALRKVEKDLPGIRKANNQAVDKARLDVAIGETFQAFRAQVNVAFLRLIDKLGLGDDPNARLAAERGRDQLLRTLEGFDVPLENPGLEEETGQEGDEDDV